MIGNVAPYSSGARTTGSSVLPRWPLLASVEREVQTAHRNCVERLDLNVTALAAVSPLTAKAAAPTCASLSTGCAVSGLSVGSTRGTIASVLTGSTDASVRIDNDHSINPFRDKHTGATVVSVFDLSSRRPIIAGVRPVVGLGSCRSPPHVPSS